MLIRGIKVDVHVRDELEQFTWQRAKWSEDKLIAKSPFRYDNSPSFYCYLTDTDTAPAGSFGDSGGNGEYAKGTIVRLLAFLRGETEYETEEYLLEKYAINYGYSDDLSLDLRELSLGPSLKVFDESVMQEYVDNFEYLLSRGITTSVQKLYGVKYDTKSKAIVIPWRSVDGKRVDNVKYRRTQEKTFYYGKGKSIRDLVFGIDVVHKYNLKTIVIVEAEIDAMYLISSLQGKGLGIGAVATGGSSFNKIKRDLILRSPVETVIVCGDNDSAGRKFADQVMKELGANVKLKTMKLPHHVKDINNIRDVSEVVSLVTEATPVTPNLCNLNIRNV